MEEKKIEKAAQAYCDATYGTLRTDPFIKEGFRQGAHWAIQEFLKGLWHPAGEEPEGYEQGILVQYKYGGFSSVFQIKEIKSWKHFVEKISIKHWCYIDDLLEQKGGEK